MIIRDAVEADLPAIVEIYNDAVAGRIASAQLTPVTVEEQRAWFESHTASQHPLWVLRDDDKVAAWLSIHPFIRRAAYDGTAEVSVYVHEPARRRGYASELLQTALARGPALGLHTFLALIAGQNAPSVQLFARFGFTRWGFLPGVMRVEGSERDLIILGRRLS